MPLGQGFDAVPLRIPDKWDPQWFLGFVKDVLAKGDVRNSDSGPGISVTSNSDGTATISGNADIGEIADGNFVLAEPSAGLANGRVLAAENGVLVIEDQGAGGAIRIVVVDNGIYSTKLRKSPALTVMGVPSDAPAEQNVQDIAATANDTILRRVADALGFGQLTAGMAPDALWPYAKIQNVTSARILGRKDPADGPIEELTLSEALDLIDDTPGAILFRDAGGWAVLLPGTDGQVLTLAGGVPTWADLPDFALADKTFVTTADESATLPNSSQLPTIPPADATYITETDETADLPNSRRVVAGTSITLDTTTPGQLEINTP